MPEDRTLNITCDECGYSEEVPSSRLAYEEGKWCPKCRKSKMWWVPPAEEARRREAKRMPEEKGISPAVVIVGGLGLGIAAAVGVAAMAMAAVPPGCLKLDPDRFYYFIYTGPSQTFKAALGECYPVIYTIDVWDDDTREYWPPVDPEHDILETGSKCRVMVQETCTLCGFELTT